MTHTHHIHLCIFITVSLFTASCHCADKQFEDCVPRNCGDKSISFPFFITGLQQPYCGAPGPGFNITCENNTRSLIRVTQEDQYLLVNEIFYDNRSLLVSDAEISNSTSCSSIRKINRNLTLSSDRFEYMDGSKLVFLRNCSDQKEGLDKYRFDCGGDDYLVMNKNDTNLRAAVCETMAEVPIQKHDDDDEVITRTNYLTVLRRGFVLKWTATDCRECKSTGGRCGFDIENYQFLCFCEDRPHYKNCTATSKTPPPPTTTNSPKGYRTSRVILITAILGASIVLMICFLTIMGMRKGCGNIFAPFLSKKTSSDIEDSISYFGVPVFSYKDLEDATHKFDSSRELGDGGYGTVYHGKLKDGREVAVKRLYENNFKRVEQFMNEIKLLTGLRHRNLVLLYGSTSHRSHELLLVYEYIPNGTVADHLHGDRAENEPLTWPVRMHIAMETASALAYLHKSDIIHRDVKTNNILLDNNFTVKVADFGLSRLFPTDATHVSTAPQGTPGYVDPEYHQCYQLTDKSDVYSFGVVLIELISSMPAVDISRSRNEINLANLAINRIQKCALDELIDPNLGYKSDPIIERMVTSVAELAFRCLQLEKELRPKMDEVYECLVQIQAYGESKSALPHPSPESEKVVLLKNRTFPTSPVTVIDNWTSSRSTTPSTSEL